jgi:hypothetical protein
MSRSSCSLSPTSFKSLWTSHPGSVGRDGTGACLRSTGAPVRSASQNCSSLVSASCCFQICPQSDFPIWAFEWEAFVRRMRPSASFFLYRWWSPVLPVAEVRSSQKSTSQKRRNPPNVGGGRSGLRQSFVVRGCAGRPPKSGATCSASVPGCPGSSHIRNSCVSSVRTWSRKAS